jgi:drug/metabolite transporter (DMT)-like permease
MDRARLAGIVLVVISACAFGSGALFGKPVYETGVGWLTLLAWRFLFGAVLSWVLLAGSAERRAALRSMDRRTVGITLALGILYVGNSATYFAGLETVPASLAGLIVYIYPALVAVLSIRFGQPLQGRRAWMALGLALAGVVLALGGIPDEEMPPLFGLLQIVASPIIYAVWIILAARLTGERRTSPAEAGGPAAATEARIAAADDPDAAGAGPGGSGGAGGGGPGAGEPGADVPEDAHASARAGATTTVASALMMTATTAAYWTIAGATGAPVHPDEIPAAAWPGLIGVGVIATFVAIQTFYAGTKRIGAAQASLISTIEPVYTVILAAILFGERLTPVQLAGGALILAAVVLAQTSPAGAVRALRTYLRIADE